MTYVTDPIADMLTRIRNANQMRNETVEIPLSSIKLRIAEILKKEGAKVEEAGDGEEGFIVSFEVKELKPESKLILTLKYVEKERVIKGLKRISKPGLRVYANKNDIPKVLNGLGIAIISTSKGLMTDKEARKEGAGGEVVAYIW